MNSMSEQVDSEDLPRVGLRRSTGGIWRSLLARKRVGLLPGALSLCLSQIYRPHRTELLQRRDTSRQIRARRAEARCRRLPPRARASRAAALFAALLGSPD